MIASCRNPLKSGQCFLPTPTMEPDLADLIEESQSPQIGSMFLTYRFKD